MEVASFPLPKCLTYTRACNSVIKMKAKYFSGCLDFGMRSVEVAGWVFLREEMINFLSVTSIRLLDFIFVFLNQG